MVRFLLFLQLYYQVPWKSHGGAKTARFQEGTIRKPLWVCIKIGYNSKLQWKNAVLNPLSISILWWGLFFFWPHVQFHLTLGSPACGNLPQPLPAHVAESPDQWPGQLEETGRSGRMKSWHRHADISQQFIPVCHGIDAYECISIYRIIDMSLQFRWSPLGNWQASKLLLETLETMSSQIHWLAPAWFTSAK